IHFASAMALMARIEGIPSRVSVGFLPGSQNGAQRLVKASQMHAWPELYFQNYGWVRFEPTAAVAQPPAWTVENPKRAAPSTAPQSPEANRSPSTSTSASSQASPAPSPDATSHDSDHGSGVPWTVIVWILVVMVLLCVPMLTRMVVRRWRLHRDDPDAFARGAWQEVQACWIDHGLPLAHATSRQQCQEMADELPEQARGALERLCLLDERARYAPSIDLDDRGRDKVVHDVDTVRDALAQQPSRRPHWLAVWMPTSLIRGSRR
ncbi:MAG: transglutaminase-like domain-containing protein, partial [Cutibacterium granulosum]|nr:transglutaminase-like domain-containing protein [Cutibacterium granulosum]